MSPADVLNRAANLLEAGEWGQGPHGNRPGTMCARDAIHAAAEPKWSVALIIAAEDLLRDWLPGGQITLYNDQPGRTKAEVLAALRAAAKGEPA